MVKNIIGTSLFFLLFNINIAYSKVIEIDVNGLVCEFCAVTIEKGFQKKFNYIDKVKVSLAEKKVSLYLPDDKDISDDDITAIVKNNGYSVVKINR